MGSYTAQILVGSECRYHGGILPTHALWLWENNRPSWALMPLSLGGDAPAAPSTPVIWIPTVETMLEDALLMAAIHVVKDPAICEEAKRAFKPRAGGPVELYEDVTPEDLKALHEMACALAYPCKLVLTILEGSSIQNAKALQEYHLQAEVAGGMTPR